MLRSKIIGIATAIFIGFSMVLGGCGTGSDTSTGTMEVRLHDAPASFDAVNVFVERVEVNNADTDTGWVVINEPQQSYDLLELSNGAFAVLGSAELETGTYNQIRLVLSSTGHTVVIDGTSHDMIVPSGSQTGVKLNVNAEIQENIEYILLLDFDASRSVVEAGQNNPSVDYLLKPVIRATNQAVTGNIAGTVDPAGAEPVVYALSGTDTLASTFADTSDGYFELVGLTDGSYDVSIDPTNSTYQDTTITGVSVTVGSTNDLGTIQLSQ